MLQLREVKMLHEPQEDYVASWSTQEHHDKAQAALHLMHAK